MTPARTGPRGAFRFEIDWTATLGFRIDRSAETTSKTEFAALKALLYQLRKNGQVEVLRGFARGEIPVAVLKQAKKLGRLESDTLLADLALLRRLWHDDARCPKQTAPTAAHSAECLGVVDALLPKMAAGAETRRRYATSFTKLRRVAGHGARAALPATAMVADLARLDWAALHAAWPDSGSDWNHLRRAVGRLLSVLFGHPHHPKRLEVIGRIPVADEHERVPELTAEEFWALIAAMPEHAQPCFVTLAATGMRLGEYLRCTEAHLVPAKYAIRVPGTKTTRSRRVVEVGPEAWPWVELAIPSPLRTRWLHIYWWRACVERGHGRYEPVLGDDGKPLMKTVTALVAVEGQRTKQRVRREVPVTRYEGLRIHDLRHLAGQVATDEGATLSQVQDALGQADPKITARYTRRHNAGVAGRKVTTALFQATNSRRVG